VGRHPVNTQLEPAILKGWFVMLELNVWNVGMSSLAAVLLIAGALLIGVITQFIGDVRVYHWAVVTVAALVGGWLGSEAFGTLSTWGPVFEGLYIVPAFLGGLVLGLVADGLLRFSIEGGSYRHHPQPI
jgi:uncharacterized membrane protein YeaQ/YmgE (transglycosylase-associated protein family)